VHEVHRPTLIGALGRNQRHARERSPLAPEAPKPKQLVPAPAAPVFAAVQVMDTGPMVEAPPAASPPVIVERSVPGIEVELVGGWRVRFERDADPETVRRLVTLL